MEQTIIYAKNMTTKDGKRSWKKYLIKVGKLTTECMLAKGTKEIVEKAKLPCEVKKLDGFIKREDYFKKDGTKSFKNIAVVTGIELGQHIEFDNEPLMEQLAKELDKKVSPEDLPF